jgi:hypothetical protein
VVGVVLAPVVAAIATIVALAKDCAIDVEREQPANSERSTPAAGAFVFRLKAEAPR